VSISRASQQGENVLGYDAAGSARYILRGQLVEFTRDWIAVRSGRHVIVYPTHGLGSQTIAQDKWAAGVRPRNPRSWVWQVTRLLFAKPEIKSR
jgi:hypothetical protein